MDPGSRGQWMHLGVFINLVYRNLVFFLKGKFKTELNKSSNLEKIWWVKCKKYGRSKEK